jgi:Lrp/AsnC family leucine-responsive transcriptional regulator
MDKFDINILCQLQKNGRMSNLELANAVGLSPSPCSRRVKHLEDEGIIEHYACRLSAKKIDLNLMALINISMDRHTPERFENFENIVKELEEVLECYLITGQAADYVIKVAVTDMEAYQQFLLGKLTRIEGVTGVHSSFVMRKVLDRTALPLNQLRTSRF